MFGGFICAPRALNCFWVWLSVHGWQQQQQRGCSGLMRDEEPYVSSCSCLKSNDLYKVRNTYQHVCFQYPYPTRVLDGTLRKSTKNSCLHLISPECRRDKILWLFAHKFKLVFSQEWKTSKSERLRHSNFVTFNSILLASHDLCIGGLNVHQNRLSVVRTDVF